MRHLAHRGLRGPCDLAHEIGARRTAKVTDFAPLQLQSPEHPCGALAELRVKRWRTPGAHAVLRKPIGIDVHVVKIAQKGGGIKPLAVIIE